MNDQQRRAVIGTMRKIKFRLRMLPRRDTSRVLWKGLVAYAATLVRGGVKKVVFVAYPLLQRDKALPDVPQKTKLPPPEKGAAGLDGLVIDREIRPLVLQSISPEG